MSPDTIASVHWFGKKRIGITFGAYYLSRIWQQPQSAQLERQTLVKLASRPGLWLPGGTNLTADAATRLYWMLDDVLEEESYLEIRAATNSALRTSHFALSFAIHLDAAHNSQWLTNLQVVLEQLTGASPVFNPDQNGWSLHTTNGLGQIGFARVGDWTVVSAGPENNSLASEISARIRRDGVPFVSAGTNLWLEAGLAPSRLSPPSPRGERARVRWVLLHPSPISTFPFPATARMSSPA